MDEVAVEVKLPGQAEADTLAVVLAQGDSLSEGARVLDQQLAGRLQRLTESGELQENSARPSSSTPTAS